MYSDLMRNCFGAAMPGTLAAQQQQYSNATPLSFMALQQDVSYYQRLMFNEQQGWSQEIWSCLTPAERKDLNRKKNYRKAAAMDGAGFNLI